MEQPIHASNDIDRDSRTPRIIAIVAGIVIAAVVVMGAMYSGLWSPPPTTQTAQAATHH
jgi:hypothetical protein